MIRRPLLTFCALIALVVVACGAPEPVPFSITAGSLVDPSTTEPSAATTAPSIEVPEGYELFDGSADGFIIALPSSWVPLDLTASDTEGMMAELEGVLEPEAMEQARAFFASGIGYALFAMEVSGDPTINVIAAPRGPLDSLENLEELGPKQLEAAGATVLSVDRVENGGTDGVHVAYELSVPQGVAEGHQYYMFGDDVVYVITFTSFDADADRDTFSSVFDTFTLVSGS